MKKLHQTDPPGVTKFPDFFAQNDLDYTSPYPCQVCGEHFRSRHLLATHPHKSEVSK